MAVRTDKVQILVEINGQAAGKTVKELQLQARNLKRTMQTLDPNTAEYQRYEKQLKEVNSALSTLNQRTRGVAKGMDEMRIAGIKIPSMFKGIIAAAGGFAIADLMMQGTQAIYQQTKAIAELRGEVQRLTGASGDQLTDYTSRIQSISDTFQKDTNEVLIAVNNFSKQTGISYNEAFDLIEKGFLAGADAGDDFLQKLKEYPVQFANAGFSAEDFIRIATQEVKGGFYDDKLLDAIKETDLSLKEFTKTQRDALLVLGQEFTDALEKDIREGTITTEDALTRIAKQATEKGLNLQQFATITADVFKGAGEDAGGAQKVISAVFEALSKDVDSYIDENNELVILQKEMLALNRENADAWQELATQLGAFDGKMDTALTRIETIGINIITRFAERFNYYKDVIIETTNAVFNFLGITKQQQQTIKEGILYITDFLRITNSQKREERELAREREKHQKQLEQERKELGFVTEETKKNTDSTTKNTDATKKNATAHKEVKSALDIRLAALKSYHEREKLLIEAQLYRKEIDEKEAARLIHEATLKFYQDQLEAFRKYGADSKNEALRVQNELLQLQNVENSQVDAPQAIGSIGLPAQLQSTLDAEAVFYDMRFELEQSYLIRKMELLKEAGQEETLQYLDLQQRLTEIQRTEEEQRIENSINHENRRWDILQESVENTAYLFDSVAEFLKQDEQNRKKHGAAIQAFETSKVLLDSVSEIAGIWRNANSHPLNAIIPGYGAIQAGILTAAAIFRTQTAIQRINQTQFAEGGYTGFGGERDQTGERFAGYYRLHGEEWIAPRWMNKHPEYGRRISELESIRQRGFASGGFVAPDTTPRGTFASDSSNFAQPQQSMQMLERFDMLINEFRRFPRNLRATVAYEDIMEKDDEMKTANRRSSI